MTRALQSLANLQGQHRLQVQGPKHLQAAKGSDTFPSNAWIEWLRNQDHDSSRGLKSAKPTGAEVLGLETGTRISYSHLYKLRSFLIGLKWEPYDYLSSRNSQDLGCTHHPRRRLINWVGLGIQDWNDTAWPEIGTLPRLLLAQQNQAWIMLMRLMQCLKTDSYSMW